MALLMERSSNTTRLSLPPPKRASVEQDSSPVISTGHDAVVGWDAKRGC